MSDPELFVRLRYIARVVLRFCEAEFRVNTLGELLDLWEVHRQMHGLSSPRHDDAEAIDTLFFAEE